MLRPAALALMLLALAGCPQPPTTTDAGVDAGTIDSGMKLQPCLDRPSDLPRPPGTSGLPCDLIPPGF